MRVLLIPFMAITSFWRVSIKQCRNPEAANAESIA
jgi:hypothetical protein